MESSLVILDMMEEPSPTTFNYVREIIFCPGSLLHTRKTGFIIISESSIDCIFAVL